MTERRRAPVEVLERLVEAVDARFTRTGADVPQELALHLQAYRAATAPLRSRETVDAEIVALMRGFVDGQVNREGDYWASRATLFQLCREPTSGTSSTPAAKESSDNAGVPAGAANTFTTRHGDVINLGTDPDEGRPCGCEREVRLLELLADIKLEVELAVGAKNSYGHALGAIHRMLKDEPWTTR